MYPALRAQKHQSSASAESLSRGPPPGCIPPGQQGRMTPGGDSKLSSGASSRTAILPEGGHCLAICSSPPQVAPGPETHPPWPPSSLAFSSEFPFLVPEEANRPGTWFCPTDRMLSPSPGRTDAEASWGHRQVSRMGVPSAPSLTTCPHWISQEGSRQTAPQTLSFHLDSASAPKRLPAGQCPCRWPAAWRTDSQGLNNPSNRKRAALGVLTSIPSRSASLFSLSLLNSSPVPPPSLSSCDPLGILQNAPQSVWE